MLYQGSKATREHQAVSLRGEGTPVNSETGFVGEEALALAAAPLEGMAHEGLGGQRPARGKCQTSSTTSPPDVIPRFWLIYTVDNDSEDGVSCRRSTLGGPSHLPRQALGLMDDPAIT